MQVGDITARLVGREKLESLLGHLDQLRKVGLQGKGISYVESDVKNYTPSTFYLLH
jgi:hypothetical protein